jgi:hypothetical protein
MAFLFLCAYPKHVIPSLIQGATAAFLLAPLGMVMTAWYLLSCLLSWLLWLSLCAVVFPFRVCRLCGAAASWATRRPAGQAARRQLELAVARGVALLDVVAARAAAWGRSLLQGGGSRETCWHALCFTALLGDTACVHTICCLLGAAAGCMSSTGSAACHTSRGWATGLLCCLGFSLSQNGVWHM